MNSLNRVKELYAYEVAAFGFLQSHGFICLASPPPSESEETEFISKHFILLIGMHRGRDENYRKFLDAQSRKEITYPEVALKFFLKDYEKERSLIEAQINEPDLMKLPTLVELELYKRHFWVLSTNAWVNDPDFIRAVTSTNQWFWEHPDIRKALADYTNKLRSFRTTTTAEPV